MVKRPTPASGSAIGNVIWFCSLRLVAGLGHLVTGVLLCLTVIGIPLGLANFKLIPVSLLPLGREIVSVEQARALDLEPTVAIRSDRSTTDR